MAVRENHHRGPTRDLRLPRSFRPQKAQVGACPATPHHPQASPRSPQAGSASQDRASPSPGRPSPHSLSPHSPSSSPTRAVRWRRPGLLRAESEHSPGDLEPSGSNLPLARPRSVTNLTTGFKRDHDTHSLQEVGKPLSAKRRPRMKGNAPSTEGLGWERRAALPNSVHVCTCGHPVFSLTTSVGMGQTVSSSRIRMGTPVCRVRGLPGQNQGLHSEACFLGRHPVVCCSLPNLQLSGGKGLVHGVARPQGVNTAPAAA